MLRLDVLVMCHAECRFPRLARVEARQDRVVGCVTVGTVPAELRFLDGSRLAEINFQKMRQRCTGDDSRIPARIIATEYEASIIRFGMESRRRTNRSSTLDVGNIFFCKEAFPGLGTEHRGSG